MLYKRDSVCVCVCAREWLGATLGGGARSGAVTYASHKVLLEIELAHAGPGRLNGSEDLHKPRSAVVLCPCVLLFHRSSFTPVHRLARPETTLIFPLLPPLPPFSSESYLDSLGDNLYPTQSVLVLSLSSSSGIGLPQDRSGLPPRRRCCVPPFFFSLYRWRVGYPESSPKRRENKSKMKTRKGNRGKREEEFTVGGGGGFLDFKGSSLLSTGRDRGAANSVENLPRLCGKLRSLAFFCPSPTSAGLGRVGLGRYHSSSHGFFGLCPSAAQRSVA